MGNDITRQDVFHFDETRPNFNNLAHQNGFTYWFASDLMDVLGYESYASFKKAINRAIQACATLNIDIVDNFVQQNRTVKGESLADYRLSRFACYLVSMNADPKKPAVAQAQAYFATIAESFRRYVEEADDVERILIRDEISDHEKTLSSTARTAGVVDAKGFALFQNAGYRGMYNMNLKQLKAAKGIDAKRSPLDFMGKEELAANLFRITQTEAKIRNEGIQGQRPAEQAAESVGRKVRQTMMEISGVAPESLATGEDIRKVRGALKSSQREFAKLDKPKK